MKDPLVSVIIPCRNSERWIGATVESALGQTWPHVEVIAVDDGSTDGTLAALHRHASDRLKVITGPQRGASAARNAGVRAAQGAFLQYLDADDLLAPGKIAAQLAVGRDDERLLTFGSCRHFDDGLPPEQGILHAARLAPELQQPTEFLIDLLGGNNGRGWMVQTGQWLVPRALAGAAGEWNEGISVDDDGEYFCRVALAARELRACPESLCSYRKFARGGNLSAQWSLSRRGSASMLAALRLKEKHLRAAGVHDDPRLTAALAASYSTIAVGCYPLARDVSAEAVAELRRLGRPVATLSTTRWFDFFTRLGGWKFARWMQHLAQQVRHLKASSA